MTNEEWLDIEGFEGRYKVSNFGRVANCKTGRVLKGNKNKGGYISVSLGKGNCRYVHRLVSSAFIEKIDGKSQINHIDGNKENNNANNLSWCSPKENMEHAINTGLINYFNRSKLTKSDVLAIKRRLALGENYRNIAKDYPVSAGNIHAIKQNKKWKNISL